MKQSAEHDKKALQVDYKQVLNSESWPFPPNRVHAGERQTELKDFGTG